MFKSMEDAWAGAVLSTENARDLYESARILREHGNIGCASALLVLCAEEATKAIGIGQHVGNPLPPENLKLLFRNHVFKHDRGAHASSVVHQFLGLSQKNHSDGGTLHGECGVLENIAGWRNAADGLKKRGFYVDHVNGEWSSPSQITDEEYSGALYIAETLLALAEGFFIKGTLDELQSYSSQDEL